MVEAGLAKHPFHLGIFTPSQSPYTPNTRQASIPANRKPIAGLHPLSPIGTG